MSTASKVTFGVSFLFAVSTIAGVKYLDFSERKALKQGPIKDQQRLQAKRELTDKQQFNEADYREQMRLKELYEQQQPLEKTFVGKEDDS